ncbi:MAG: serine/threonine protein kinase [Planctomycetes bacterium]|nr:serine/threonine protein kinase [Planctomycetota bacterium]
MNESKVRPIYERALALPPEEREAFVRETCGADAALCDRVLALLQANDEKGDYLARPTGAPPRAAVVPARVDSAAVERQGTVIGRYCLLQQIGEGGMGTVWMAEQREPVRRKVALKIIKLGMDSKQVSARFEAERQALALMDHPSIAKVLDGGTTDTGRPYFVMELVKGVPLTTFCDEAQLDIRARLTLFAEVCQAVQHAHQKGIIHRDIKPSNVLVTLHDGRPVPKVIDFGIAKATNQELTQKTLFTEYAQILGTPGTWRPNRPSLSDSTSTPVRRVLVGRTSLRAPDPERALRLQDPAGQRL